MRLLSLVLVTSTAAFAAIQNPPSSQNPRPGDTTGQDRTGQDKTDKLGGPQDSKHADAFFATALVVDGNNEVAISQLATTKATDPEVKAFAQKMVEEHRQMTAKLQPFASAAPGAGATGSTATGQPADASFRGSMGGFDHIALMQELGEQCLSTARRELESKQGAEFDRCFMGMQVGGHMKANDMLTVFQRHAGTSLKPVLADAQRDVAQHLEEAKSIAKKLEGKATSGATGGK